MISFKKYSLKHRQTQIKIFTPKTIRFLIKILQQINTLYQGNQPNLILFSTFRAQIAKRVVMVISK